MKKNDTSQKYLASIGNIYLKLFAHKTRNILGKFEENQKGNTLCDVPRIDDSGKRRDQE